LREDPYPPDKDSRLYDSPANVAFHGYAASGKVHAEVVYANGGSPEDFQVLDRMGIDLKGKIVLMRYSNPYSYRGYKVYEAERRGAAGTLIYSDPAEDGSRLGPVYPDGPWGPDSHIQWGAILYDWLGQGEPFTFHWKRQGDGKWVEGPQRDKQLPKIPSMPLNERNAAAILKQLGGPEAPKDWQGGLADYLPHRPGPVTLDMDVQNDEHVGTLRSVIGVIRGPRGAGKACHPRQSPRRLDLRRRGSLERHRRPSRDRARARRGRQARPPAPPHDRIHGLGRRGALARRLDAMGARQRGQLRKNAVDYVNVDTAVQGGAFTGGATPALADFLREVTKDVPDPLSGDALHDAWASRFESGVPDVETIVGATDYTAFQEYLGISCIDMYFDGPYGVYHSMYDDYYRQSTIVDPGFAIGTGLSSSGASSPGGSPTRPCCRCTIQITRERRSATSKPSRSTPASSPPLHLAAARAAARRWETAAIQLEEGLEDADLSPAKARAINDRLMEVERVLVEPTGMRGRPFIPAPARGAAAELPQRLPAAHLGRHRPQGPRGDSRPRGGDRRGLRSRGRHPEGRYDAARQGSQALTSASLRSVRRSTSRAP
jgi:N-acetylated-alpha-linked acidic dipeptidase